MKVVTTLREIVAWLFTDKSERDYARECELRESMTDEEFAQRYYSDSTFPLDIPIRVRRVIGYQLGFNKLLPQDKVCDILQDIDFAEIMWELADEFDVKITLDEMHTMDGSLDSIIRFMATKDSCSAPEQPTR